MATVEINSFVSKFVNLWKSGLDASLKLESHAGQASLSISLGLGSFHETDEIEKKPYIAKKVSPSRARRRKKRAKARQDAVNFQSHATSVTSTVTSSYASCVISIRHCVHHIQHALYTLSITLYFLQYPFETCYLHKAHRASMYHATYASCIIQNMRHVSCAS